MLILQADQVQYLDVIQATSNHVEPKNGLSYQNKLFKQGKVFAKNQSKEAIQYTRDAFEELKVACLLVEDNQSLAFWYEEPSLQAYDPSQNTDILSNLNLHKLAREMRDSDGIKIQDRWYNLKVYPRCFIGSEAVAWMISRFKISTEQAIALGQRLVDARLLHHVANDQPFQNKHLFYRFYWDD